jgi:hypothetical protein
LCRYQCVGPGGHLSEALRDTASKSDYTLDTICALYLEELEETNADLAKRYE